MLDYSDSYSILYKGMIDCAKEIKDKSVELASTFYQLQRFMQQMSELQRMVKCQAQYEVFDSLAKVMQGSGQQIELQGEVIGQFVGGGEMKYQWKQEQGLKELFGLREQVKGECAKDEKTLVDKKEKMFKSRDIYKWGGFKDNMELLRLKDELLL